MRKPFALAVSDIDGTIATIGEPISKANLEAIRKLQSHGIEFALASGRHHNNMRRYCELIPGIEWLISSQGAWVSNIDKSVVLYEGYMSPKHVAALLESGRIHNYSMLVYTRDAIVTPHYDDWIRFYEGLANNQVVETPASEIPNLHAYKMVWLEDEARVHDAACIPLPSDELLGMQTQPNLYEFMPATTNKGFAVSVLAKHKGLEAAQVITLGDAINDVSMLKWAGCGIAMGHGADVAKDAARIVTPPADPSEAFAAGIDLLFRTFNIP